MATYREGGYGAGTAAADLDAYTCVKVNTDGTIAQATTGTAVDGVVEKGDKAGATVSFAHRNGQGSFKVKLGGTVAVGDNLTAGTGGLAVKTTTSGNVVFGTALHAGVSGDVVEYLKCDKVVA
jgi:hypothetical protein